MPERLVNLRRSDATASITLNDPKRRNALGLAMLDDLSTAIASAGEDHSTRIVLLEGAGRTFCAGFDLAAAVEEPELLAEYIRRLSRINRTVRRLPHIVVIAVQGAAIAGGCALLGAGDLVVMSRDAKVGYPVHRIGISPAVTIPMLLQAVGPGVARELLMSGRLIGGEEAYRTGLATHLAESDEAVSTVARSLCEYLMSRPPHALRITKEWLNELEGSLDDRRFEQPAEGSIGLAFGSEAQELLRAFWNDR